MNNSATAPCRDFRAKPPSCVHAMSHKDVYRLLLEGAPSGYYACDAQTGALMFLSNRGCSLLGYEASQVYDLTIADLVHPDEHAVLNERIDQLTYGGPLVPDRYTYTLVRRDGTTVRGEMASTLIEHEGRKIIHGILRDVTQYEVFQGRMEHAQRLEAIAIVADGIADRLLKAVSVIQTNLEGLEKQLCTESRHIKYLAQIRGAGRAVDRLAVTLLSFSRGGMFEPAALSVNDFIAGLLPVFRCTIKATIGLSFDPAMEEPVIYADGTSLQTMLSAIIANADEAIAGKGRIRISVQCVDIEAAGEQVHPEARPGRYVCIGVKDNGAGMSAAVCKRVCEPYFSTKLHGRGLGMAAVYGIVKRHGGWLTVDSQPGRGTRVCVYLRASPAAAP